MSEDWDTELEGGVATMSVGPSQTGSNFGRPQHFGTTGDTNENRNGGFFQPSRGNRGYGRGRSRGTSRNDAATYQPPRPSADRNWRSQTDNENNANGFQRERRDRNDAIRIMVLNSTLGRVIGKGGQTIKDLQSSTGASIRILKDEAEFVETPIEIIGDEEAQRKAKEKIEELTEDISSKRMRETANRSQKPQGGFGGPARIDWGALAANREANETARWAGLPDVVKVFYKELKEVEDMNPFEVASIRKEKNSIMVSHISGDEDVIKKHIQNPVLTFEHAFHNYPEILDTIYNQNFTTPSPIQCQAWPVLLSGDDLIGVAQTGTGKTLAFLLPALIHIDGQPLPRAERVGPSCLVLSPTRELAQQIEFEVKKFHYKGIKSVCIYGGGDRREQIGIVQKGVEIVIGTPGRLNDLLMNGILSVEHVTYLVLDEADRMLDMGFEPEIKKIILDIRPDRQTVMTSATWPQGVQRMANQYLNNPVKVNVGSLDLQACHTVTQLIENIDQADKKERIIEFINNMEPGDKMLMFAGKKITVDDIASDLVLRGIDVGIQTIHGDREQSDRESALEDFKTGAARVLIATDVASRGLDIKDISHVINYDFPRHIEEYVHRIGRTGRAGRSGTALTFVTRDDWGSAHKLIDIMAEADQEIPDWLIEMSERYKAYRERMRERDGFSRGGDGGGGGGGGGGNACFKCGEEGHFSRECRNAPNETSNSRGGFGGGGSRGGYRGGSGGGGRPRGACYSCGEIGHMSNECPTGGMTKGLGRDFGRVFKEDDKRSRGRGRGRGGRGRRDFDDNMGFMF